MRKFVLALTALTAFMAAPAFAGGTHISVGFYTPASVYYAPSPVYYQPPMVVYPPVQQVYFAPRPYYGVPYGYGHRQHYRGYNYARNDWNGNRDYDHDGLDNDRGGRHHH